MVPAAIPIRADNNRLSMFLISYFMVKVVKKGEKGKGRKGRKVNGCWN